MTNKVITVFCMSFTMLVCGCKQNDDLNQLPRDVPVVEDGTEEKEDKVLATYDMNRHKVTNLVCDPFNNESNQTTQINLGVKASLFWLESSDPKYSRVTDYLQFGQNSSETLFFSKIDVPTRLFDLGFPKETGELLKNDLGEDLVEYFGLRFDGKIQLSSEEGEGVYEFAILSDDGTVLRIDPNGQGMQDIIDNDGNHPTRMGCGENAKIEMTRETQLPFQLDYYQGPRRHISVVLLWRKHDESCSHEPLCGVQGNRKYFDFDNNSQPQTAYLNLLDRGWKPLQPENFVIKESDSHNPCVDGEKPVISEFEVNEDFDGGLMVSWQTDIHATSQVRVVNLDSNEETLTDSDNFLRKSHFVRIFPEQNVPLLIQAVSVSDSMGKALSQPITMVWEP